MKQLSVIVFALFLCAGASSEAFAQRKTVSGEEVTGTFRYYFTGRFKDSYIEILIQALGGNKLKIEMKLIRPNQIAEDRVSVNVGEANGEAVIQGDTAKVFRLQPVLRQNLIRTPNTSHWSHITPVNMLYLVFQSC
jgi:hypothetical protein